MKKFFLVLVLFISIGVFGQKSNTPFEVPNSTTAFGRTLPVGQLIFNKLDSSLYSLTAPSISTNTLNTSSKYKLPSSGGSSTIDTSHFINARYGNNTMYQPLLKSNGDTIDSKWEPDVINIPYNYGNLYNWYAVNTGNLAPTGWHVPTDAEWTTLTTFLGGESVAGSKLKSTRTDPDAQPRWDSPNTGATNETGFIALPGGYRNNNGTFNSIGYSGYWWSATELVASRAWYRNMSFGSSYVYRDHKYKEDGFFVRIIRDNLTGYVDGETVTDVDGNIYQTVKIGTQVWSTQNLRTTKYNDGTSISNVTDNTAWNALTTEAYCTYGNDPLSTYEDSTYYYSVVSESLIKPKFSKQVDVSHIYGLQDTIKTYSQAKASKQLYYDPSTKLVTYGDTSKGSSTVDTTIIQTRARSNQQNLNLSSRISSDSITTLNKWSKTGDVLNDSLNTWFGSSTLFPSIFKYNSSEKLRINGAGVSIPSTSKLEIKGSTISGGILFSYNNSGIFAAGYGDLRFNTAGSLSFYADNASIYTRNCRPISTGTNTIGTLANYWGTYYGTDITLNGTASRSISIGRHTTSNTAGLPFYLRGSGATTGSQDKSGGSNYYMSGVGTGLGGSSHYWYVSTPTSTGTTDNTLSLAMTLDSVKNLTVIGESISKKIIGEIYDSTNNTTSLVTTGYTTLNSMVSRISENTTNTDSTITVGSAGYYHISYHVSFSFSVQNSVVHASLFVNDAEKMTMEMERKIGTAGDVGNMGSSSIVYLPANAVLKIKATTDNNGTMTRNHECFFATKINN